MWVENESRPFAVVIHADLAASARHGLVHTGGGFDCAERGEGRAKVVGVAQVDIKRPAVEGFDAQLIGGEEDGKGAAERFFTWMCVPPGEGGGRSMVTVGHVDDGFSEH